MPPNAKALGDVLSSHDFNEFNKYKNYKGVLSHDKLTHKIKPAEFGVINLDDSNGPGTHWVGYFNHKDGPLYFDSFGIEPDERTINFLKSSGLIRYNNSQLQGVDSKRCGWFVKHWLNSILQGKTFYDSLYDEYTQMPSDHNERIVKK